MTEGQEKADKLVALDRVSYELKAKETELRYYEEVALTYVRERLKNWTSKTIEDNTLKAIAGNASALAVYAIKERETFISKRQI